MEVVGHMLPRTRLPCFCALPGLISARDDNVRTTSTADVMSYLEYGDEIFVTMNVEGTHSDSNLLSDDYVPSVIFTGEWISRYSD